MTREELAAVKKATQVLDEVNREKFVNVLMKNLERLAANKLTQALEVLR